jgi:hypothetical protein
MLRAGRSLLLAAALASRPAAAGEVALDVAADATMGATVAVTVSVTNRGAEEATAVAPEVRYRLAERTLEAAVLPAGARRTWAVEFPLPSEPGGEMLVVLVRWQDARGARHSVPYARVVETPGLLPTEAQLLLGSQPAAGHEIALAQIVNATPTTLRGRLVAIIPEEYFTTPLAQPVEVAPRETIAVPVAIQSEGPPGTSYPVYAVLQFAQGGISRAIVAGTTLGIGTTPDRSTLPPLVVGTAMLALAVGVTLLANRRAARRRVRGDPPA